MFPECRLEPSSMPEHGRSRSCRAQCALLLALFTASFASAQVTLVHNSPLDIRNRVRMYRAGHEIEIIREFSDLLAIPNVAGDHDNILRNGEHIVAMLQQRGVTARLLEVANGSPLIYGELKTPGAKR